MVLVEVREDGVRASEFSSSLPHPPVTGSTRPRLRRECVLSPLTSVLLTSDFAPCCNEVLFGDNSDGVGGLASGLLLGEGGRGEEWSCDRNPSTSIAEALDVSTLVNSREAICTLSWLGLLVVGGWQSSYADTASRAREGSCESTLWGGEWEGSQGGEWEWSWGSPEWSLGVVWWSDCSLAVSGDC